MTIRLTLSAMCAAMVSLIGSWSTWAQEPTPAGRVIPYEGILELDRAPITGSHDLRFCLYDSAEAAADETPMPDAEGCGASAIWFETQPIEVIGGRFNTLLGQLTPLEPAVFLSDDLHVTLAIADPTQPGRFVRLTGSQRIVPVPRTYEAEEASNFSVHGTLSVGGSLGVQGSAHIQGDLVVDGSLESISLSPQTYRISREQEETEPWVPFDGYEWTDELEMTGLDDSVCFLTVAVSNVDVDEYDHTGPGGCQVIESPQLGVWVLRATARTALWPTCEARCLVGVGRDS